MARPVEFDRAKARDRALALFWRKGYLATSLADLTAATGLSRSSFYASFGEKRALFIECLDLFAERTRQLLLDARTTMPPVDAIEHFFAHSFDGVGAVRDTWGCMMVNTVLEAAGVDDGLRSRASDLLQRMNALFVDTLVAAGLPLSDAEIWADIIMTLNEGLRVESRRRVPGDRRRVQVRTMIGMLRVAIATSSPHIGDRRNPRRTS
jgi:TetR/AcrR family transcriptional repressor of nem operon